MAVRRSRASVARHLAAIGLVAALSLPATALAQRLLVVGCDDGELRAWSGWQRVDTVTSSGFVAMPDATVATYAALEISHCIDATLEGPAARRKVVAAVRNGTSLYSTSFNRELPFVPGAVAPSRVDTCADQVVVPVSAYTHPIIASATPPIRSADLSSLGCAVHGSFVSASTEYTTLATSQASGHAVLLAAQVGCGRVVLRSQQFHSTTEARAVRFVDSVARWLTSTPARSGIDSDGDGIDNSCDSCPAASNAAQSDCDGDGIGDACDVGTVDGDGDGVADACDSCPASANGVQGIDADRDGVDDACDNCASVPNTSQADCDSDGIGDVCEDDGDGDRVPDACDDCPLDWNPRQVDGDGDGTGDACDTVSAQFNWAYFDDVTLSGLEPDHNTNYPSLQVLRTSHGNSKYPVIYFDTSGIPDGAHVVRAQLQLFQTVKLPSLITMHFVLRPWRELQVTYSSFAGAYDPTVISTHDARLEENDTIIRFEATTAVRAWVDGERPNYGILLTAPTIGTTRFGATERTATGRRPLMYVDYTVPEAPRTVLAAEGLDGGSGRIWAIDVVTGQTELFGHVGRGVRGLATSPTGALFATGLTASGGGELLSIDVRSGAPTVIGPLTGGRRTFAPMADCTFTGDDLYCWSELDDQPVIVDVETGEVNLVGGGVWAYGTGFAADRDGVLYVAPHGARGALYTVDPRDGDVTELSTLRGTLDWITAMTFLEGTLYAIESTDDGASVLVSIDPSTGVVTTIAPLPPNVAALARFGGRP
ncbi:DNRLRE domain-containing protein [Myxococcota bacterium]|nr:DNRLRE domain-containing protein [Myxococcota bacterium]